MPEPGTGATPATGRVGTPSASDPQSAQGLALGFDFGTRRIGVAVGSVASAGARPLCVIAAGPGARAWEAIASLIDQWKPSVLVVGVPCHPDGRPHAMTARCERFARQLQGRFGRTVVRVDERYSSAVVGGAGARDDRAAAVILQQWLDEGGHA
ncbi:MAG TPA: Holliday junction resolvase RuvX [Burkholderiaceae bacterium]|jgi:putative Holliday junction resolvase|nr:Holliday junction resolvase RuvX [Burkholderiaceae bacterium]